MNTRKKPSIIFFGVKYFPSRGGTSRVVENIIKKLVEDYNVTIYCYKNKDAENFIKGVKTIQIPEIKLMSFGVFIYFFISTIHLLIFKNRKNIIHAHKTDCAFFLPLLKLKFKIVATSHEAPYKRDKWTGIGRSYFKLAERVFVNSGVILTSISKPLKEYYESKYHKKVHYIPNGIISEPKYDLTKAQEILDEHKISGDYVMFAARRIMSTKGAHTMLKALRTSDYRIPVLIAGDLSHAPNYVSKLRKDNKDDLNIIFLGEIKSLPTLMGLINKSKLFIFPSETEGMSIMLLEAVISGANVISSDIPENKQVFNENEILFFSNKDHLDLSSKIEFALNNDDKMNEYRIKALEKVKNDFNWDIIVERYKSLYDLVLK